MENDEIMSLDEILQDPYYLEQYEQRIKAMTDGSLKADKSTDVKWEGNNMEEQATITTPEQAAETPTAAVTVDMEAINKAAEARAERAAQTVVKDMLKQQGLDDAAIKGVLDEWKAKQTTPEQALKQRDDTIGTLTQQLESEKQEKIALSKGVPIGSTDAVIAEKVTACLTLAKSYTTADVAFDAALDKALKIINFEAEKPTPPPMWGGSGTKPLVKPSGNAFNFEFQTVRPIPDKK